MSTHTEQVRPRPKADPAEILATLQLLTKNTEPGAVFELRVLHLGPYKKITASGYFTVATLDKETEYAAKYSRVAPAVYRCLNPVNRALHARAQDRMQEPASVTSADKDIEYRIWLPIDCDPERPSEISSSDVEHEAALARAQVIKAWLKEQGWPDPVEADSGNGAHLYVLDNEPNDQPTTQLIKNALEALGLRFTDKKVKVDQTCFNASRIFKLYGTAVAKGDNTLERPHRLSHVLHAPIRLVPVSREQLQALAHTLPEPPPRPQTHSHNGAKPFDIYKFIGDHLEGFGLQGPLPYDNGAEKWIFGTCPFNSDHTNRSAILLRFPSGAVSFKCHHEGCRSNTWQVLREKFEGPREAKAGKAQQAKPEREHTEAQAETKGEVIIPPFKCLGFTTASGVKRYHYYSPLTHSFEPLSGSQHKRPELFQLAPEEWWLYEFSKQTKNGPIIDWSAAQSWILSQCAKKGFYDPAKHVRGVGTWPEGDRTIFHRGDAILDGELVWSPGDFVTEYLYDQRGVVRIEGVETLSDTKATKLLIFLGAKSFRWAELVAPRLLAGWIVTAPLAGALRWRPNAWLTGGEDCGKSTVLDKIVVPALGGETGGLLTLVGGSATTEAGIRQRLGPDAVCVVYDEADPNDAIGVERLNAIVTLMRSTNTPGEVAKGSGEGHAVRFPIRSAFLVSSIAHALDQAADRRRTSVLTLNRPKTGEKAQKAWLELMGQIAETITPAFGRGLIVRTIKLAPVILANIEVYRAALLATVDDPGAADQISVLLAGAHALEFSSAITLEDATKEIANYDLSFFAQSAAKESRDELALWTTLMQSPVDVDIDDPGGHWHHEKHTIGELLEHLRKYPNLESERAKSLERIGLKLEATGNLLVANAHPAIKAIPRNSKWAANFPDALRRLRGLFDFPDSFKDASRDARFAGYRGRATILPKELLDKMLSDEAVIDDADDTES